MNPKRIVPIVCAAVLFSALGFAGVTSSAWTQTQPGAGGAFVTIGGGPSGIIVVGSDLSGAYSSTDGGLSWDNIGNTLGIADPHTSAVGFHVTNENTVFLGTEHALYRSTNFTGAKTFSVVESANRYWTTIAMTKAWTSFGLAAGFPGYNSSTAIIYQTTDIGATWTAVDTITNCRVQKILINPAHYATAYMLSQDDKFVSSSNTSTRLYKTTDGGTTWSTFTSGPTSGVLDFDIDPDTPTTLYYTTTSGTYKSTDSGTNWSSVSSHYGDVRCKSGDTVRVFNIVSHYTYESTNGGSSWTQTATDSDFHNAFTPTFAYGKGYCYCKTVGSDLSDGNTYYWATGQWVYKTTDGGANWYQMYSDSSDDDGDTYWAGRGISNAVPLDAFISSANHNHVYIAMADLGLWYSETQGDAWISCNDPSFTGSWNGKGGDVLTVLSDPSRSDVVWCGMGSVYRAPADMKLIKSTSEGLIGTWSSSNSGLPTGGSLIMGLSLSESSPSTNRTLFVTSNGNIYKSTDDGANWVLKDSLGTIYETAVDPSDSNYVYAGGDGGFYRSTDAGETWDSTGSSAMTFVKDIKIAPTNTSDVYAACFGSSKGLYRSTDHGSSWTKILSDDYSRSVAIDPTDEDVIYHASSKAWNAGGAISTSTGMKRTTNGGSSWTQVNEGLQWPFADVIAIDPSDPTHILIGTPGTGFQRRIFDEPSGNIVAAVNGSKAPKEFKLYDNYPNPFNPSTTISYQLPDAETRYKVSLKVYDELGREVAVLEDGVQEGGFYKETFDASRLASGMYFSRLFVTAENGSKNDKASHMYLNKMLLLK